MLKRRRQHIGSRDLRLRLVDAPGKITLERLHRRQAAALVESRYRLVVAGTPDELRKRRMERNQLTSLLAHAPADPLRFLDQSPPNLFELGAHLLEIGISLRRILAHGTPYDSRQVRRDGRIDLCERRGILGAKLLEELHRILAGERWARTEKLVEHRADGEHVRSAICTSAHLLGRDVAKSAHDQ